MNTISMDIFKEGIKNLHNSNNKTIELRCPNCFKQVYKVKDYDNIYFCKECNWKGKLE